MAVGIEVDGQAGRQAGRQTDRKVFSLLSKKQGE